MATDGEAGLQVLVDRELVERPPPLGHVGHPVAHDLLEARPTSSVVAWYRAHVSNGPTEAASNLIKRIKRVAFGFTQFRNYRIRTLLYCGRPNWSLLATIKPR